MKPEKLILPLAILTLLAVGIGAYSAIAAPLPQGFPEPTEAGAIEVKNYPAYRAATVNYSGQLSEAANRSFYTLYQHLEANEISMTAPVETRYPMATLQTENEESGEAKVSFLYRRSDMIPEQVAENIEIEDIPAMTVVSLGLRGGYDYPSYQSGIAQLRRWLEQHPQYVVIGAPRRFFYDAPYIPSPFKRSEIQIPVRQIR